MTSFLRNLSLRGDGLQQNYIPVAPPNQFVELSAICQNMNANELNGNVLFFLVYVSDFIINVFVILLFFFLISSTFLLIYYH